MKNERVTNNILGTPVCGATCLWERMCEQRILPFQEPKTIVLWKPSTSLFHSLLSCFGCYDFSEYLIPVDHPLALLLYLPECGHLRSHIFLSIRMHNSASVPTPSKTPAFHPLDTHTQTKPSALSHCVLDWHLRISHHITAIFCRSVASRVPHNQVTAQCLQLSSL